MRRFRGEVSGPIPEGWFAKGSVTLLSPDGQANIIASSEPLDPSIDTVRYAEVQGELLTKEFPGFVEREYRQVEMFGGRKGYLRAFEWRPRDGEPVTQIQMYHASGGRGFTATATTPSARFAEKEFLLRQIMGDLVIET
jgi:hypothetical protein